MTRKKLKKARKPKIPMYNPMTKEVVHGRKYK